MFAPNQYTITGSSANETRGVVTGGCTVDYLDSVTITAIPNYGYHFTAWNDGDTTNPRTIEATRDSLVTAYFDYNQYSIILNVDTNIHGSISGGGLFSYISEQTITATANYGYHFTAWNDGDTNNPRVLTLTQDTAFTALFTKNTYTITAISNDTIRGVVTGSTLTEYLDSVTIVAIPNYGYHFTAWNDGDTTNPRTIETIKDSLFTAYFDYNQYSITLNVDTNIHGLVTGGGLYNYTSEQTISATPNYGYHFTSWNDGDTTNPRTITLTQDTLFTALFAKNSYSVSVVSADTIWGNVTGNTTTEYLNAVSIAATANYGYHFLHWNDGDTTNPRVITLTQDTLLTAYFAKNWYSVIAISDNDTMGYVSGGDTMEYLDSVSLTATSNHGYHFSSWNDGDTNNPRVVCITQDTSFMALFAKNQYTLTVQSNDETQGGVSNGGVFDYLDTVTISAIAIEHYHFVRWDDGNTLNPRNIVMTSDISRSAIFAIDTHSVTLQAGNITHGSFSGNGQYQYGTAATVEALPYSGYQFSHWSDGSTYNPYTFAVVNNVQLTAHFYAVGSPYQDTLYLDTLTIHDTVYMNVYLHDTTYVPVHDTTIVTEYIHDTTTVTEYIHDTTTVTEYIEVHDTVWLTEYIHDTIYIHDTVYVGIDGVDALDAKIYSNSGQIVVEGAEQNTVTLFDINGRALATKQDYDAPLRFDVPATGTYMVKIGNHPARKVVVIR